MADDRTDADWWDLDTWPTRVAVMRHATHDAGVVTPDGREQIRDVGRALREWCHFTELRIAQVDGFPIPRALTREVEATAALMRIAVDPVIDHSEQPERRPNLTDLDAALRPTYRSVAVDSGGEHDDVFVAVLNEPQAGELVNALTGADLAPGHAELVLLERRRHHTLTRRPPFIRRFPYQARWTMAPRVAAGDPLRQKVLDKIASKMRTAGTLGALITTLLTFVLTRMFDGSIRWGNATFAAFLAFAVSATFFFIAMFFYDSLTMPSEFWGKQASWMRWRHPDWLKSGPSWWRSWWADDRSPAWMLDRPPSGTSRVLQINMVRIWTWVFLPATLALGVGVGALLIALDTRGDPTATAHQVDLGGWRVIVFVATGLITAAWGHHFRPRTGASD